MKSKNAKSYKEKKNSLKIIQRILNINFFKLHAKVHHAPCSSRNLQIKSNHIIEKNYTNWCSSILFR